MTRTKTYDSKCYELAVHFLADHPELFNDECKDILAWEIQNFIEDEIMFMRLEIDAAK